MDIRFFVTLPADRFDELREIAEREQRDPRRQAAVLLASAIELAARSVPTPRQPEVAGAPR
ncbi:MAG: hypothetical protein IT304_04410 [Dehalococcoidia bacterium]|nr:hypothetical protein [Dehalococcoidia bacterium]